MKWENCTEGTHPGCYAEDRFLVAVDGPPVGGGSSNGQKPGSNMRPPWWRNHTAVNISSVIGGGRLRDHINKTRGGGHAATKEAPGTLLLAAGNAGDMHQEAVDATKMEGDSELDAEMDDMDEDEKDYEEALQYDTWVDIGEAPDG